MKTLRIFSLLLLMVLVPCLSVSSVEVYQTQPCIDWGDWTIGQSSGSGNAVVTTFITNSEKTACVKVAVKYCASQPSGFVYPIERFDFQITMNNGFKVSKEVEWSSGPAASELSSNTKFSVEALLEGPADTTKVAHCDGKNGRGNTPMSVTIKFIGYYGSDSENVKTVTLTKTWTQDTLDMLRQEYVDMTPPDSRAELPVPARGQFKWEISSNGVDGWNTGHYSYMIDNGLKDKKSAWFSQVNAYRKANTKAVFSDRTFKVNSAYRNPYHQRFHVNASRGKVASFHSRHCYGDALDIETLDVDDDDTVEQVVGNKAKSDDGVLMENAAILAGALWTASWEYYGSHTHADWTLRRADGGSWPPADGTVYSPPCDPPKDKPKTTTTKKEEVKLLACGHESGAAGYHIEIPMECGEKFWYCHGDIDNVLDSHQRIACPLNASGEKCQVLGGHFYACAPHTHKYPDGTSISSPGSKFTGECGEHQVTASEASSHKAVGYACGSHSYYPCLGEPSSAETSQHLTQTLPCGSHVGRACLAAASHLSPVSCPQQDGKVCSYGSYYTCSVHTHAYPKSPVVNPPPLKPDPPKPDPKPTVQPKPDPPANTKIAGACGVHQIASSEASSHEAVKHPCGSHSYYPCQGAPSASEKNRHITQTLPCGSHVGRACLAASSHLSAVSCPQQDGKTCSYGSYYTCSVHTHAYPKTPVVNPPPKPKPDPVPKAPPKQPDPDPQVTSPCGHTHAQSESSSHTASSYPCGSHTYYPCLGTPSFAEQQRHKYQELACCVHYGYPCSASTSHTRQVTCPKKNGKACTYGYGYYYGCSPHTHKYPPSLVACGGASYTGCLGASSRTAHHVALCRSGCGNGYWTCSATAVENHETVFTCRRSGCGQTFTRCTNTPTSCVREGKPSNYHWAR